VISDLWRAGELPDPYHDRNSRAAEWTADRHWVYRRTVDVPEPVAGELVVLEFDGIDPSGSVFWDGELLGRAEGLYHRARFTVPAEVGPHRLAVVLDPVPPSEPQVGRTERVRVHRPRMNYGWDFCPRFPHQGIWRPVRLVVGRTLVADASLRTVVAGDGSGRAVVSARVDGADAPVTAVLLDPRGAPVAEAPLVDGVAELRVDRPELWQPRGLGEPVRYRAQLRVAGAVQWERATGFRQAELTANPGAPAGALPYTAVVNGRVVPLVGWNWVPADAQYGALDRGHVEHLVRLAADSGARVLRVWGGGLLETEDFYDACDRAGLLVWQEFSQSSSGLQSAPATDDGFVGYMTAEAEAVIPPRTHHPSLLLWCGGNELDTDGRPLDEARSPVLAALRDTVHRLDPGRAWLPTSPSGPVFHNRLDAIEAAPDDQHDVHGPWEHQGLRAHHTLYNAGASLAHTEFGVEGMTNRRALDRLVPPERQWPADRSNPVYRHLGEWWNNAPLVQESFAHRLADVDALRRASQLLQATGLAYALEADRRRAPRCSMVLPWQLNESYPNAWCTSSVDHQGTPKPAYFAAQRAFARRRATVRVPTSVWGGEDALAAEVWLWDEDGTPAGSLVTARLRSVTGEVLAQATWPVPAPVTDPRPVGTLAVAAADVPADAPVVWDVKWESDALLDREIVLAATGKDFAPLLDLADADLDVSVEPGLVRVAHRSGPLVVGLQLADDRPIDASGPLLVSGDPRPLLPGESRCFIAGTPGPLRLEGWNIRPVRLDIPGKETPA
jgi:beta-mannosidase